jgi:translation initiation factor 2 subunit 1
MKPNGVTVLKGVFSKARNVRKPEGSNIKAFTIGAPKYRVEVTAENYKDAEDLLERFVQTALKAIKAEGGEGKPIHRLAKEE